MSAVTEMAVFVLVLGWAGWHAWTWMHNRRILDVRSGYVWPAYDAPTADPLPSVVAPGSVATWFIRPAEAETTCVGRGYHTDQLHALVTLRNGRTVRARHRGIGPPG
jgi:hypothetical protein